MPWYVGTQPPHEKFWVDYLHLREGYFYFSVKNEKRAEFATEEDALECILRYSLAGYNTSDWKAWPY